MQQILRQRIQSEWLLVKNGFVYRGIEDQNENLLFEFVLKPCIFSNTSMF